ncbi:MAG: hypothetical protein R3348_02095, partial [Xanthomonadales bacterium]|nr:hypothetical protein [Xanthomonadales bacterium]
MRLLLVAQEPPLDPGKVVTGNALRAAQLTSSLAAAGHEVIHVSLSKAPRRQARQFRNRDDLRSLVLNEQPDVILVCFWHLLDLLPFDSDIPVVLDFVAPRPLEEIYQAPDEAADSLRRLRLELAKVDLVLVGNAQQSSLLLLPLIEAGHDLRQSIPIAVVPLAAEPVQAQRADPGQSGWTIVTGGVSWPWRRATAWLDALQQRAGEAWRLVVFGGDYALHPESKIQQAEGLLQRPLEPYQQYSAFLAQQSHIGLELSDDNVERRFSQSFRSLDFLRHGLPLICN